jgi:flagellar biosynthesis protein
MAKKPALDDGRRTAVALTYTDGQRAPKVVAKGYGEMADRIIERAKEAGVFVHDSPELVSLLMQVDLDSHIPPDLYRAIAEVLAFIYFLEHQTTGANTRFEDWLTARGVPAE